MSIAYQDLGAGTSVRWTNWHTQWDEAVKFGQMLKRKRRELGWTQEVLALKAELSWSFIKEMEQGVKVPSFVTLNSLACVFGCTMADLMKEAGI